MSISLILHLIFSKSGGITLGYGSHSCQAQRASTMKSHTKVVKTYKNDGRAPDTVKALSRLTRRSKRKSSSDSQTGAAHLGELGENSKRQKSDMSLTVGAESGAESSQAESEEPEPEQISSSSDDEVDGDFPICREMGQVLKIDVNGTLRELGKPSGNAHCYIGLPWKNNSCAYDTSLEVLFILANSKPLEKLSGELASAPREALDTSDHISSISLVSLFQVLRRRQELYSIMAPGALRDSIAHTCTIIHQVTLGAVYKKKNAPYTSLWVRRTGIMSV